MHYLITGGAGFIGSHLAEQLLQRGARITIIDDFNPYYNPEIKWHNISGFREDIELIEGDIRDAILIERSFAKGTFDHIIHLAARAGVRPSIKDPKLYFTTNIDGTFNLFNACRYHGVRDFHLRLLLLRLRRQSEGALRRSGSHPPNHLPLCCNQVGGRANLLQLRPPV